MIPSIHTSILKLMLLAFVFSSLGSIEILGIHCALDHRFLLSNPDDWPVTSQARPTTSSQEWSFCRYLLNEQSDQERPSDDNHVRVQYSKIVVSRLVDLGYGSGFVRLCKEIMSFGEGGLGRRTMEKKVENSTVDRRMRGNVAFSGWEIRRCKGSCD